MENRYFTSGFTSTNRAVTPFVQRNTAFLRQLQEKSELFNISPIKLKSAQVVYLFVFYYGKGCLGVNSKCQGKIVNLRLLCTFRSIIFFKCGFLSQNIGRSVIFNFKKNY